MICPYCGADDDKVIDSRASEGGRSIRRRRQCNACSRRFTTYERVDATARLVVVKRDGSRVPFDRQKLLRSIQIAFGKRPIPDAVKRELAEEVDEDVHRAFDREVESVEIGKRVASRLRDIDQIAYVRFASEYYRFENVGELEREIAELRQLPRVSPHQSDLFPDES